MTNFLLPGLSYSKLRRPASAGQWYALPDLTEIAADLDISDQLDDAVIKSVPDAWAPVRAWKQAVFYVRHQLHVRTRSRWRGLFSVVGLVGI